MPTHKRLAVIVGIVAFVIAFTPLDEIIAAAILARRL